MRMVKASLLLVVAVLHPAGSHGATRTIDSCDALTGGTWQNARSEEMIVKSGTGALRWDMDSGPLVRKLPNGWPDSYRSLRFWVHAEEPTFQQFEILALAPDEENAYVIGLRADGGGAQQVAKVDWWGWNEFSVAQYWFVEHGEPQPWSDVKALMFRPKDVNGVSFPQGYKKTSLVFDDIRYSTDWPVMEDQYGVYIDAQFQCAGKQNSLWRPTAETKRRPEKSYGWGVSWPYANLSYKETAGRDVCVFGRDFNVSLDGFAGLELRVAYQSEGYLSIHMVIDGRRTTPVSYRPGKSTWEEIDISIPPGATRLERIEIDLSEPPDETAGTLHANVNLQHAWLMLRKRGVSAGWQPHEVDPPAPLEIGEDTLLENGLPAGVYFKREDIPRIRRELLQGYGREVGKTYIGNANKDLQTWAPERFIGQYVSMGTSFHVRSTKPDPRLFPRAVRHAMAYIATGDLSYAQMVRRILLASCRIGHWEEGLIARQSGWGGYGAPFRASEGANMLGFAYDCVWHLLPQNERREIERNLYWKGIRWTHNYLMRFGPGLILSNQGMVFSSRLGIGCLALAPHNVDAASHLADAEKWIFQSVGNYFFPDGGMSEGPDYWRFAWGSGVQFLGALANRDPDAFRRRMPEGVHRSFDYPLYVQSNNSREFGCISYSDCSAYQPGVPALVAAFFAKHLRNPDAAWLLRGRDMPGDLDTFFLWNHGLKAVEPKRRLAKLFPHAGIVSLRSGFNYGDVHLNMQCGPYKGSHMQGDRAAFVIEAYGENLALEPGLVPYSDPRGGEFGKTRLHNALTLGGQTQLVGGEADPAARITTFVGGGRMDYFTADATGNYAGCQSYRRRVLYLRPDAFVISDEMQTENERLVEWNLNSTGVPELRASRLVQKAKRARLLTVFAMPQKLTMVHEEWPTNFGQTNHHVTLTPVAGRTRQQRYLAYLKPLKEGTPDPSVEAIRGEHVAGFSIGEASTGEIILENLGTSAVEFSDIRFEGRMAAVRTLDGRPIAAFLAEGTRLSKDGRRLIECSDPGTVSLDYAYRSGGNRALLVSVQAEAGTRIAVCPPSGRRFASRGARQNGWVWQPMDVKTDRQGRAVISVPREGCPTEGLQLRLEFDQTGRDDGLLVSLSTTVDAGAPEAAPAALSVGPAEVPFHHGGFEIPAHPGASPPTDWSQQIPGAVSTVRGGTADSGANQGLLHLEGADYQHNYSTSGTLWTVPEFPEGMAGVKLVLTGKYKRLDYCYNLAFYITATDGAEWRNEHATAPGGGPDDEWQQVTVTHSAAVAGDHMGVMILFQKGADRQSNAWIDSLSLTYEWIPQPTRK